MNVEQIRMWISIGSVLIQTGTATVSQFQAVLALLHPGMAESDLNAILAAIRDDARRRIELAKFDQVQALADADA